MVATYIANILFLHVVYLANTITSALIVTIFIKDALHMCVDLYAT